MEKISLARMTGQANSTSKQQFMQVATTDAVSVRFWAFTALGGNAVLSLLTNDGTTPSSALGYWNGGTKTAYQDQLYTGQFAAIKLVSGIVKLELGEQ
jgi:hypothetical protein